MRPAICPLVVLFSVALVAGAYAAELFVAPDGDDAGPGTRAKPFRTLEAARDAVRRAKGAGGATVWLKGGRYCRTKTFELGEADSGTKNSPVVYKAVEGGAVFLDAGKVIPPSACRPVTNREVLDRLVPEAREKTVEIGLKALGITDYGTLGPRGFARPYRPAPLELFINGKPQQIARWPNAGQPDIPLGKVLDSGSVPRNGDYSFRGGVFRYETRRAERWAKAKDLYISGIFNYGFADDTIPVAELDTAKGTIKTTHPHLYGFTNRGFTKWFALNLIEEIDLPGEYCVDKATGVLYLYPPCDLRDALIQVSMLEEPMVALEGASHVRFENLTFENARGSAFYIERGAGNLIAGCTLRNIGIVAVQMGKGASAPLDGRHDAHGKGAQGLDTGGPAARILGSMPNYLYANTAWDREAGTGHGVLSCDIYDTGAGGIVLGGGDRKSLTPAGNFVENCQITRVNRLDRMYRCPINLDGVGNRIAHCLIHDSPGQAILLHGNDHIIELNHIHHVVTDISDQAAIYMGRDPSEAGNVFRHNFFHDIFNYHKGGHGVQAIFFDDFCTFGATVVGNVFYKAGSTGVIKFNGGGACPIINNLFIACPAPLQGAGDNTRGVLGFMKGELGQRRLRQQVDITQPPYATRYPLLKAVYEGKAKVTTPFERNYVARDDLSQFVDPKNLNLQLKKDSKVYQELKGFEPIPFEKIGLYPDRYRKPRS